MLQLPAHSEATERKTLLWNQEILKEIHDEPTTGEHREENNLGYERISEISK